MCCMRISLTSSPRCTRSGRPPTNQITIHKFYRCGYLRLLHRPRRSMRSSSRTACRAASSIIAQALDRCRRPRRPLALSCLTVHLMAAADTKTMYTVTPCVDANTRRGGTADDEARDQRNGRELQSDYLLARGESSERKQKVTF